MAGESKHVAEFYTAVLSQEEKMQYAVQYNGTLVWEAILILIFNALSLPFRDSSNGRSKV